MSHSNALKINLVGSTTTGMTGEVADEVLIDKELRKLGFEVNFIQRDIWKAYCDGEWDDNWKKYLDDLNSNFNIICKWYAFDKEIYTRKLREESGSKVFYWVWDWMDGFPHGHDKMIKGCDLYLGNDVMHPQYKDIQNKQYFPMDVADGDIPRQFEDKIYDVVFFGSCIGQGLRTKWIPEIAKHCKLKIFASNYQDWIKMGLDAEPAVYGDEFAKKVAQSKICLQFSVDDNTWGYWSNRVGKILTQGGFLLAHYTPGMELFLKDGIEYFRNVEECVEKIKYYLENEEKRKIVAQRGYFGSDFTMQRRIKDLLILRGRFI